MKKYYTHDGHGQQGPFDISELKVQKVLQSTPVWYEGLARWTPAGELNELDDLFNTVAPPVYQLHPNVPGVKFKKRNPSRIIAIAALSVVFLFFGFKAYEGYHDVPFETSATGDHTTYREKVQTVEEIERGDPQKFLKASCTYHSNLWGDKFKVNGEISNMATVANYKDVVIKIIYYSETETELHSENRILYDRFTAHSSKTFEIKTDKPKACTKLGIEAINATAY